jgi:diguanylate cyclase (GGDEF)-like protein
MYVGPLGTASARRSPLPSHGRATTVVQVAAIGAAAVLAALTVGTDHWDPWAFVVIAALTVTSDLTFVETGSARLRISGSFLGLMLAAVLLGGGPAALIGVLTISIGWLRSREDAHYLLNNIATYAWFPLLGGLFFYAATRAAHVGPHALGYYLLVFAAFVLALALNFLLIAGYQCHLDGTSLRQKARDALIPILASELFSALLTLAAVYVAVQLGTPGLALFALVLVVFQHLVGALLVSKRRSDELRRMASTDGLTGLANREHFQARVEQEIGAAERAGEGFGVMLIDLDRFKEINDTLGHHYGDVLLRELGPRLAACVGEHGLVARLGGDEFALLIGRPTAAPEELEQIARRLIECVQQPFVADELSLEVGGSIGISRFPHDGRDAHALLRSADVAMYAAKESQSTFRLYAAEHDHHSLRRLSLLSGIRHALAADQVVVHYQPKVELDDLTVQGAEALVRWQHPELGLLAPGTFIQAVEQTGLIGPLTRHVLSRAIAQCAGWRRSGRNMSVAVNLSVRNLLDRDLPREIEHLLSLHGLPPEALQLEITERMIMSDPDRALTVVTGLSALGVRLSVDDFGTGYSSLANLKRLPIDELKIDRSFVSPMLHEESDLIIVRSTINLGHDLGLKVIAEGVEDAATLERLTVLGCDLAQGYHVSRPLASDAFVRWLAREEALRLGAASL